MPRTGFRTVLDTRPGTEAVVAVAENDAADGLERTRRRSGQDTPCTVIVTTFDPDENVRTALHGGASGFPPRRRRPGGPG